jgi:DNA-binding transcriptional regulator YbjK
MPNTHLQTAIATPLPDATPRRATRRRGARTRQEILEATLRLIAREGIAGVTHRAVAQEAGVNLSLTTYYFTNLTDLLCHAFRHFESSGAEQIDQTWDRVFRYVERVGSDSEDRQRVRDYLVRNMGETNPVRVAVKQHFFNEALVDAQLGEMAGHYRARLRNAFEQLCERIGSTAPSLDADLLFGTLLRLEQEALSDDGRDFSRMRQQLSRLIDWITGPE